MHPIALSIEGDSRILPCCRRRGQDSPMLLESSEHVLESSGHMLESSAHALESSAHVLGVVRMCLE